MKKPPTKNMLRAWDFLGVFISMLFGAVLQATHWILVVIMLSIIACFMIYYITRDIK